MRRPRRPWLEELEPRNLLSVLTPAQLQRAYGFAQVSFVGANRQTVPGDGRGETIAIVDAFDDPSFVSSTSAGFASSDLARFDRAFNLPDPPSFRKVDQTGGTHYPKVNSNWAGEIALDVEWAHAIAPLANILLVEAASDGTTDLIQAIDYARNQPGVVVVSLSWGATETSDEASFDSHFTTPAGHPGVTFVASSGDAGSQGGPLWPAVSPNVVSVGGTHLGLRDVQGTYGSELGWSGSGGGYSAYEPEPAYQRTVQTKGQRANPDVAYDGDPASGVYVYETDPVSHQANWFQVGGTSAGAPQWAALIAIADQALALAGKGSLDGATQTLPMLYKLPAADFHDVVAGNNGNPAGPGYDLVTGRGSPVVNLMIPDLVRLATTTPAVTSKPSGSQTTKSPAPTKVHTGAIFVAVAVEPAPVKKNAAPEEALVDVPRAHLDGGLIVVSVPAAGPRVDEAVAGLGFPETLPQRAVDPRTEHLGGGGIFVPGDVGGSTEQQEPDPGADGTEPEARAPRVPADDAERGLTEAGWRQAATAYFEVEDGALVPEEDPPALDLPEVRSVTQDVLMAAAGCAVFFTGYWAGPVEDHDLRKPLDFAP
jgi:hypothetical protein